MMEKKRKLIGSLDQGTSSTRFLLVDAETGHIVSSSQKEHQQYFPEPGWVEHDANEIWTRCKECITETMQQNSGVNSIDEIVSIGITNQRETCILWDKETGIPVCNAIVWNCARTSSIVKEYQDNKLCGDKDALREKTGLPVSTYFSATKMVWMLRNVAGVRERAERGELCFGTIDSWLIWKLTEGKYHVTDITNAARTLICNIHSLQWDPQLLEIFDIPKALLLPKIEPSIGGDFGTVTGCQPLNGVPIGAVLGDQHAALFGQVCFNVGEAKATFGTGAFLMMNTGKLRSSTQGLLTTPFYQRKGEKPVYALEGAVAVAGSLIQWLRDNLELGKSAVEIAQLASTVNDANGLVIVPAFNGLFAPYWREDARGVFCGLTFFHTKAHMARAALDAAAFQSMDVFNAMVLDSGVPLSEVKVDGGMTANDDLLQFLADVTNTNVSRPQYLETTALGVAYAAGLSSGIYKSLQEIKQLYHTDRIFKSKMDSEERAMLKKNWDKAVDKSLGWVEGI
uniref:glycerol kinase n=1 Tax=Eucampia antarctica TaxID=49252 RepID=A0A7S2S9L1_9STRA|eukprot:CAMPEP_0197833304 /NCGR_PEP_ID=MMETSP1437-20131217/18575_1 /TAXON_ID=49252 ORGANISM="Eucampia antarctica, Strain CCMP1452" /NCGR_SAMPLE_ID=MMETSP1437 /ASSEMBLY_ACC=CAM_ASM_001096 /LENGTH=510 /DNA_ID=CAMNT_0043437277 /DNA_START=225 /DNA_END=1757 /DNA_ORIENTATION=-